MIVIADTSPLNYLVWIGEVDVLPALYPRIVVPPIVCQELSREGAPGVVRAWISRAPAWLETVTPVGQPDSDLLHTQIHAGEREAILLAQELKADELIMDDLTGRREAERRHLRVTGTIGVLRAAARADLINLKDALDRLSKTNFHLSQKLYDQLIAEANQ
jgi:predicted nucleic acid-binding protein